MKFLLILLFAFSTLSSKASIKDIPDSEFKKIKYLFEYLITEHDFSYVIFGSKPMSLADICLWMPDVPPYRCMRAEKLLSKKKESLTAWYKYKNEFIFSDFILLDKEEDLFDCLVFVLIHKKNMLALLHRHKDIFKEKLGDRFEPEEFLKKIENRKVSLAQAINHHYGLLGIMLGYGIRNSMLYQERHELQTVLKSKKMLLGSSNDLERKLKEISGKLENFSEYEEFAAVKPLYFCADKSDSETQELKKRYTQDRELIQKFMKDGDLTDKAFEKILDTTCD